MRTKAVPATGLKEGGGGQDLLSRGGGPDESTSSIPPKQARANYTLVPNADAASGGLNRPWPPRGGG